LQTQVLKSDVGINGRVVDTTTYLISLSQTSVPGKFYGSFKCELAADWNFWLRKKVRRLPKAPQIQKCNMSFQFTNDTFDPKTRQVETLQVLPMIQICRFILFRVAD